MWTSICIIQEVTRKGAIVPRQKTVVSGKKLVGIQMSWNSDEFFLITLNFSVCVYMNTLGMI